MPNSPIHDPHMREAVAIVAAMVVGFVARTLTSDEKFNMRNFIGEMLLSAMMGGAIYLFGLIQELGFLETLLIALWSGMGATRTFEWIATMVKSLPKNGG